MIYAICGFLYYPSLYSFVALLFVFLSTIPILLIGLKEIENKKNFSKLNALIFFIVLAVGILNLNVIAHSTGYEFSDIFSLNGVGAIATKSTLIRYEIDTTANSGSPILLAISLWLIFRTALSRENSSKFSIFLAFLPIIFYTVLTTEKWPTFLAGVFYFAGVFSSSSYRESISIMKGKLIYTLLIVAIMVLSLILRGDDSSVFSLVHKLLHYVFSSYYGLGYWIIEKYQNVSMTFGSLTFIGPLSYFTDIQREAGVYSNSYYVYDMVSNIYTAFRYVIQDFSLIGPLLINTLLALIYTLSLKYKFLKISNSVRILVIFIGLLSLNTTPFVHNSVFLAILLAILSVTMPRMKFKKRKKIE